jgi:hypothetical protein
MNDAPPYRVEKQGYSRGAWRVLDAADRQVWRSEVFAHPTLGRTVIDGPVCFDRKRDALAWVAGQAAAGSPA